MSRPTTRPSWPVELYHRGRRLELMHRGLGFSTLALVTLAPLLIVVAAADPLNHGGFALWLVDGMDLSGRSAEVLSEVFNPPRKVVGATSVLGGVLLAVFGLSFAASVQNGYERVWRLPAGPWHRIWRQAVWLCVLTVYLYVQVQTRAVLAGNYRMVMSVVIGVLFFWWGPHFLLGGQVRPRLLLPGAVATMAGLVGLRAFSYLVLTPLLVTNAVGYGSIGTILVVESWLVGAGFVVHGGALVGHLFCDRAGHLLEHREPVYEAPAGRPAQEAGDTRPEEPFGGRPGE
ncbi:ribonuclease BN [Streptomyces sp. NPDC015220]|uniref:ribonuclease BN n=1 Tax=Streptomyces sp. NPDC015220 TaxID=3364947 RepID=UPI0036F9B81D